MRQEKEIFQARENAETSSVSYLIKIKLCDFLLFGYKDNWERRSGSFAILFVALN